MIESEKVQNALIIVTILVSLLSASIMVGNANYYVGSYGLAHYVDVELAEIRVSNADNESLDPVIRFILNFQTRNDTSGDAAISSLRVVATLNRESIYGTSFRMDVPFIDGSLHANYNRNFTLLNSLQDPHDRDIIYDAYASGNWTWHVTVYYYYSVFMSDSDDRREIGFSYEGVTLV